MVVELRKAPAECGCGCEGRTRRVVPVSSTDQGEENEADDLDTFSKVSLTAQMRDVRTSAKPKLA
jgi:hypothetical protein